MSGLFAGTPLERPVTCDVCSKPLDACTCPRDASGAVRLPADQPVVVRVEKRRKGKVVTTVTGLDPDASDLAGLLKSLKAKCGSGGTVREDGVEVQGDHREAIAATLSAAGHPVR